MKKTLLLLLCAAAGTFCASAQEAGWAPGEKLISKGSQLSVGMTGQGNLSQLVDNNFNTRVDFPYNTSKATPENQADPHQSLIAHFDHPVERFYFSYVPRQCSSKQDAQQNGDAPHTFTVYVSETGEDWVEGPLVEGAGGYWPVGEWFSSDIIELPTDYEWVKLVFHKNWTHLRDAEHPYGNPSGRWTYWEHDQAEAHWEGSEAQRIGLTLGTGSVQLRDISPNISLAEVMFYEAAYVDMKTITFNIADAATGKPYGSFTQKFVLGTQIDSLGQVSFPENLRRDFVSFEMEPFTVSNSLEAVTIKATWDGPFEISPNTDNAHWYVLRMRDEGNAAGWHYAKYGEPISIEDTEAGDTDWDLGLSAWAFIGDPYNGFAIVSKLYPNRSLSEAEGEDGIIENEYPEFVSGLHYDWIVGENLEGGFYISNRLYDTGVLHRRTGNNTIVYWTASRSKTRTVGSTVYYGHQYYLDCSFNAVEYGVEEDYSVYVSTDIAPWFENVGEMFYISPEADARLRPKMEAALVSCNAETFTELYDAVHDRTNFSMPANGAYFRLYANAQNSSNVCYARFDKLMDNSGEIDKFGELQTPRDHSQFDNIRKTPSTVFQYVERADGKCALYNLNANRYIGGSGYSPAGYNLGQKLPADLILVPCAPGQTLIYVGGGNAPADYNQGARNYLLANCAAWAANRATLHNDSWWTFEPADDILLDLDAEMGGTTYGTIALTCDFSPVAPAAAYTLDQDGNRAVMTRVNGVVHGDIPVLIASPDGAPNASLKIESNVTRDKYGQIGANILASIKEWDDMYHKFTTFEGDLIIQQDGLAAIFKDSYDYAASAGTVMPANRAFITLDTYNPDDAPNGLFIYDPATGVETIAAPSHASAPTFDLQGRRVSLRPAAGSLPRGIYVANGKKLLVK